MDGGIPTTLLANHIRATAQNSLDTVEATKRAQARNASDTVVGTADSDEVNTIRPLMPVMSIAGRRDHRGRPAVFAANLANLRVREVQPAEEPDEQRQRRELTEEERAVLLRKYLAGATVRLAHETDTKNPVNPAHERGSGLTTITEGDAQVLVMGGAYSGPIEALTPLQWVVAPETRKYEDAPMDPTDTSVLYDPSVSMVELEPVSREGRAARIVQAMRDWSEGKEPDFGHGMTSEAVQLKEVVRDFARAFLLTTSDPDASEPTDEQVEATVKAIIRSEGRLRGVARMIYALDDLFRHDLRNYFGETLYAGETGKHIYCKIRQV